ncbi:MAG: hypothetical protein ACFBSF_18520 [Leptolyngbyaceae cyanobacterium]
MKGSFEITWAIIFDIHLHPVRGDRDGLALTAHIETDESFDE